MKPLRIHQYSVHEIRCREDIFLWELQVITKVFGVCHGEYLGTETLIGNPSLFVLGPTNWMDQVFLDSHQWWESRVGSNIWHPHLGTCDQLHICASQSVVINCGMNLEHSKPLLPCDGYYSTTVHSLRSDTPSLYARVLQFFKILYTSIRNTLSSETWSLVKYRKAVKSIEVVVLWDKR